MNNISFKVRFFNFGVRYIHPIDNRECPVVIGGDYITTESGTGLVHTAPGHGQEDYVTGLKYGLPILSPVGDDGKFTEEAGQFSGLDVLGDGNIAVVNWLDEHLSIIMEESYGMLSSSPPPKKTVTVKVLTISPDCVTSFVVNRIPPLILVCRT